MKKIKGIIFIGFHLILFFHSFSQETHKLILPDTSYTITDPDWELILAASEGDTSKVKALLELGANVNYSTLYEGITPLMYAAQNGHLRTVEILIDSGANVNAVPYNGVSALLGACIAGHIFIADTLILNGANINIQNYNGATPLMHAAAFDDYTMADMLLFYKPKVDLTDNLGNTALLYSVFYDNLSISELLVENGATINHADNKGFTPLHVAAQNGHTRHVEWLIHKGADISAKTNDSLSALSLAIVNRQYNAVDLLCEKGIDVNGEISGRLNELSLAKIYGGRDITNKLIEHGAEKNNKLWVNNMIVGAAANGNLDDFMLGFQVGLLESKFGLVLQSGYKTRPWVRSVLYERDSESYYQFWEQRSCIHLGLQKQFTLYRKSVAEYLGFFAGLNAAYTYGNFRGSNKKPNDRILPVPLAGFFYIKKLFNLSLNYEYMQLKNTNVSGHRINFIFGININLSKTKIRLKKEPVL